MLIALLLLIIIILLILIGIIYRILRKRRAMILIQELSKKETDAAVNRALKKLRLQKYLATSDIESQLISDVWGRGVLAFAYEFKINNASVEKLAQMKKILTNELLQDEMVKKTQSLPGYPVMMVTDFWIRGNLLHFDVANVINKQTAQYVHDISKVE